MIIRVKWEKKWASKARKVCGRVLKGMRFALRWWSFSNVFQTLFFFIIVFFLQPFCVLFYKYGTTSIPFLKCFSDFFFWEGWQQNSFAFNLLMMVRAKVRGQFWDPLTRGGQSFKASKLVTGRSKLFGWNRASGSPFQPSCTVLCRASLSFFTLTWNTSGSECYSFNWENPFCQFGD